MKSNDFLSEDIASDAHEMHLDHEVQMARKDCYTAADDAIALHKLLRNVSEQQGLEGWVAAKITLASDYLKTVREHLEYQLMSQVPAETMELPLAEGLADEFMAMAKAKGMNPRLRGTPDEERARTDAMLKQRAADRAAAPAPAGPDAEERAKLQARLKELEAKFDPNFEYSDDHSFWSEQNGISKQISAIKQRLAQGVAEALRPGFTHRDAGIAQDRREKTLANNPKIAAEVERRRKAAEEKKKQQQGVAEGVEANQDYAKWLRALHPHGDGASAFDLLRGDATTIRNILAYVKQNRQELGREVSAESGRTVKDAIIDIRNEFPQLYRAAQQSQNVSETSAGSVAGVVNPTPKNKAKVGTLFGGTYKQKKTKA